MKSSHVPHKSLNQVHAIFMPDAAQAVNRFPLNLSWRPASTPVLTPSLIFRHLINGSLSLISLIPTWHSPCHAFSSTLTTKAFDLSSLRWFEACSCKPAPRGLPSSSVQLRTLYIKSALVAHLQLSKIHENAMCLSIPLKTDPNLFTWQDIKEHRHKLTKTTI